MASPADTTPVTELIETHSTRAGQNRVYVETPDGVSVGYIDLTTRSVVAEADGYDDALNECLARWAGKAPRKGLIPIVTVPIRPPSELPGLPPAGAPPRRADEALALRDGSDDLALNRPGAATWAKRNEVNARAPVRNRLFSALRLPTLERSWRIGALGEEEVAYELSRLGPDWRMLHSVPGGSQDDPIDHLLMCPAGVFTLTTVHRPNSRAIVTDQTIRINGERTDHLRRARGNASRAAQRLSDALRQPVDVCPVVVLVGFHELTIDAPPPDVHVTTSRRMAAWLRERPTTLHPGNLEVVFSLARRIHTWR